MNNPSPINLRAFLLGTLVAVLVFLGLAAFAFTRPQQKNATTSFPYTQQVNFGYSASAPSSPVYPDGNVRTGDPIFLQFVHQLRVQVAYGLSAGAQQQLSGTEQLVLRITGPTGWTQSTPLTPVKSFSGSRATASATVDLNGVQGLIKRIEALTAVGAGSGYTIAVVPQVHVNGTLAGQPLHATFAPALNFQLAPPQLRPSALAPSQHSSVSTTAAVANRLTIGGTSVTISVLRDIAAAGLLLSILAALLLVVLIKRTAPFGEAGRIQAQYGHLIVPIAGTADDLAWAPFDVPNIEALVRLAEACDRLILHYREDTLDTYLVNDEGTVYRYQSRHSGVVWGEWSTAPVARLDSVPPPAAQDAPARA